MPPSDVDVPELTSVRTRSLTFGVRELGEGEPVVLVHGFPQDSWMWRHQMAALSDTHRCIAPDTRGYGGTDKPGVRVTRDLLARDLIDLLDALELERVTLVGHDWGGIIASATALRYPDRIARLGLIDTLVSVWIPWGIHGWWFKDEPRAEQFFAEHARSFIGSIFGGRPRTYGGPPATPWAPVEGSAGSEALDDFDGTRYWTEADVDHYVEAFDDPAVWFHAVEYYRHALPFHRETADPTAPGGRRHEFLTSPTVAAQWNHPGTLLAHPEFGWYPVFAPEDRHLTYTGPTLYLYSPFLVPGPFADLEPGAVPPDDVFEPTDPYTASFVDHFPALRTRGAACGHFVPEEDPERTTACLRELLDW